MGVAIVIPCHNAAGYVGETVTSVLGQYIKSWTLTVVDDGSTDGSAAAVALTAGGMPAVQLVLQANGGVAAARNRGFGLSDPSSRYLLFLDADDVLEPDMLAVLVDHMERHPHVGMAYCGFRLIEGDGRPAADDPGRLGWFDRYAPARMGVRRLPASQALTPFESVFTAGVLLPSTTLIRRSVYEQTPGFDESFGHLFEDADLFRQLAIRADVHRVDRPLVQYRRHRLQSTADVGKMERQRAKLDRKWHDLPGLTPEQRRRVRAAEWFRDYRLAPYLGVRAGWAHLRRGRVPAAVQFLGGAARRYALSLVCQPDPI